MRLHHLLLVLLFVVLSVSGELVGAPGGAVGSLSSFSLLLSCYPHLHVVRLNPLYLVLLRSQR